MKTSQRCKKIVTLICAISLLLSSLSGIQLIVTAAGDGSEYVGQVFAPDMTTAWGTQNNNGWYYMYQNPNTGTYSELNFYDSSATIDWQKNNFAFDPGVMGEMLFISPSTFFTGENGSKPVYAYKAPVSGQVRLKVSTHGLSDMHMTIYNGDQLVQVNGQDSITFVTTGTLPGAFTENIVTIDVIKDQMIYLTGSTTGGQRQGWVKDYSVEYLSVTNDVVYVGNSFAPDKETAWGTQDNNGWFYMYQTTAGEYKEMNYYDSSSEIGWQQNAFASDPYTLGEMFFINKDVFFTGENGSKPVYAYKAPIGGEVTLTVLTHGQSDLQMRIMNGADPVQINSNDAITFVTTGGLPGGFTETKVTMDVKKNSMIYMICSTTGATRQGWVKDYSVEYLSTNDSVDYTGYVFTPDFADGAWGTQNNNGWYYMYKNANTGAYTEMNYYDATSEIGWQQNSFAADPYTLGEMFFINKTTFFTGELGSKPVYAFKAPVSGQIKLSVSTHGTTDMHMAVYNGNELVQVGGNNDINFVTTGTLPGGFTQNILTIDVIKDTMVYLVCSTSGTERQGWVKDYSVEYLSVTEDNSMAGQILTPDLVDAWGTQNNNNWFYMYQNPNTGGYTEMNYYDSTATIDWQKNNFASDPTTLYEMVFISKNTFFTGENGSKPTYAFKAPIGGQVRLTVNTHGSGDMHMKICKNNELVQVNGQDAINFVTTGTLPGAFTQNTVTIDVKKDTMVYLVGYTTGAERQGWVNYYSMEYLSTNDLVEDNGEDPVGMVEVPALDWNKTNSYEQTLHSYVNDKTTPRTWLFVGDSITANDGNVSDGFRNYSEIFESYLTNDLGRPDDTIVNTAVSGWKIGNINYQRDIAAYNPDVVYVKIGTNDSFASDLDAAVFKADLKTLFKKIKESGAIPVIAVANGFSSNWGLTSQTENFAARYPTVIRELAYEMDLLMVDYYSVYAADKSRSDNNWFNADTIHPNRQGYLALAQTFINDLDLAVANSTILAQNPDTVTAVEKMPEMVLASGAFDDYITDGTTVTLADVKSLLINGFELMGGSNAVGESSSLITRRGMDQLLSFNNQKGRQNSVYGNLDTLGTKLSALGSEKAILLMPEAFDANGNNLASTSGNKAAIAAMVDSAITNGKKIVLITPPSIYNNTTRNTATTALSVVVKEVAAEKNIPLIDLNAYLDNIAANETRIKTEWLDANGMLNYAGAVDSAMLVAYGLGIDYTAFSSKSFSEDFTAENWGTQGINNFYYLFKTKVTGEYAELPFITAEAAAEPWIANRYANADPYKFLFIGKQAFHVANDYNPAKAFKAPIGGTVQVTLNIKRSLPDVTEGGTNGSMYLKVFKNDEQIAIKGEEKTVTVLAGGGAYQTYVFNVDVKKNTMLYIVPECAQATEGYMTEKVTYLTTNDQIEETEGQYVASYQPDYQQNWGTQGVNNFYYMFQNKLTGVINELGFVNAADAQEPWIADRFANPDPYKFLFIGKEVFHAANDYNPTIAFKAPVGGHVKVVLLAKRTNLAISEGGTEDMYLKVLQNDTKVYPSSADQLTLLSNNGSYSAYVFELDVKKDTMLYFMASCETAKEGFMLPTINYISTNDQVESGETDPYLGKIFAPEQANWGTQNNNNWYFMSQNRLTGSYEELPFVPAGTSGKEAFEQGNFSAHSTYPFLFISPDVIHPGSAANVVKAFKSPIGGKVQFTLSVKRTNPYPAADGFGNPSHMTIFKNETQAYPYTGDYINITDNNGEYLTYTFDIDVKKNTMVYFVLTCDGNNANGEVYMQQSAKYLTTNDTVEEVIEGGNSIIGKPFVIDTSEGVWGNKNNNNWEFMYFDTADQSFKRMAFVRSENMFKGPSDAGYEYLMIKTLEMHPSELGNPAKVFVAPETGTIELSVLAILQNPDKSTTKTGISIYKGNNKIYPTNAKYVVMGAAELNLKLKINVNKGEKIAVVLDAINGNNSFDATNVSTSAKYLSLNEFLNNDDSNGGGQSNPDTSDKTGILWAAMMLMILTAGYVITMQLQRRNDKQN